TTVGFGEAAHNEIDAAALTASRFQTDHHVEIIESDLERVLNRVVDGFDEPFADASAVPTFHVAGMARRHATVVLSGDGGDEAFGGYSFRYTPHAPESMVRARRPGGARPSRSPPHALGSRVRPLLPGAPGRNAAAWLGAHWPRSPRIPRALRWG